MDQVGTEIYETHVNKLKAEKVLSVTVGDGAFMFVAYSPHFLCATIHRFSSLEDMAIDYDIAVAEESNVLIDYFYLEKLDRLVRGEIYELGRIGKYRLTTIAGERLLVDYG